VDIDLERSGLFELATKKSLHPLMAGCSTLTAASFLESFVNKIR
jgi:hypothetical protein